MKIEKLPSGSYRIRKMYKGTTYTVVTEYKPTQKEALQLMAEEMSRVQTAKERMTFQAAAEKYMDMKSNVLSPSTIRGYTGILRILPDHFKKMHLTDIDAVCIQKVINGFSADHSPKYVRNIHGFISAILGTYCPNLIINTTLPQKRKNEPYIPSDEDIRRVLECAKNTEFEIPIILACYGMRRSEICALTPGDINGDTASIRKAKVQDAEKNWITKSTKTTASTRDIVIPADVADKIQERGYVYKGHPNAITCFLYDTQDKLGIPRFSIHKLRHYFASKMSALNVPEADIMKYGGWQTDYVMKSVYRHSMEDKDKQMQRAVANRLGAAIFSQNP